MTQQEVLALIREHIGPRDQFKPPFYEGDGDVELFIQQFQAVAQRNRWTEPDTLLHLQLSLRTKARDCGGGTTVEEIYENLRLQFGISSRKSREALYGLTHEPDQSLAELGLKAVKLARAAHPNLRRDVQEEMALEAFSQALGDLEAQRHLMVIRPQTMVEAIKAVEDFWQVGKSTPETETPEAQPQLAEILHNALALQARTLEALQHPARPEKTVYKGGPGHRYQKKKPKKPHQSANHHPQPSKTTAAEPRPPRKRENPTPPRVQPPKEPKLSSQIADIEWANHDCMYLPGKISSRRTVRYLLDSGCTENVLSRSLFQTLPEKVRATLYYDNSKASMADGSGLTIYGIITLPCKLRTVDRDITFKVANITDDAILGMRFFKDNQCILNTAKGSIEIGGNLLQCVNRCGEMLSNRVQIFGNTTIRPGQESQIICRLVTEPTSRVGLVEHQPDIETGLQLAATLVKADRKSRVVVRCLNTSDEPIDLKSGTLVGVFTPMTPDQIYDEGPVPRVCQVDNIPAAPIPGHVIDLYQRACANCATTSECQQVAALLQDYSDVFSSGDHDVGLTSLVTHSIPVEAGTQPIRQPPRRLGVEKDKEVDKQVTELLESGKIEPADGAWSSPVVLVRKKDNSWRLCIDYRRLNAVTRRDAYPLPRIDDSLDALSGSVWFSTLDLLSGYWQVPLDADAQEKSAFVTRGGLWRWKVLPFGLTSAPATFERLMEGVLKGLQWKTLLLYLDDVVVFSTDFESHLERLSEVLNRFRSANLKLKPSKCEIFQKEVKYLGHVVNAEGISTDPAKVQAVHEWEAPRCPQEVRSFLGFVGYYRRFCPDFATVAKPLTQLTEKRERGDFPWGPEEQAAFEQLKAFITTSPVLAYPNHELEFILDTDASLDGAGAVLSQIQDGEERVIAYWSKRLAPSERNYCVTRRELLAVIKAMVHFRPYLYGRKFSLRTDHASLQWLYKRKDPSSQVARWLELLAEFHFTLTHRPGAKHGNADGMSRVCSTCKQCDAITTRDGGPHWRDMEIQESAEVRHGVMVGHNEVNKITISSELKKEVAPLQQQEGSDTAIVYALVRDRRDPTPELLELCSPETKKWCQLMAAMNIGEDGILRVRLHNKVSNRYNWVIACPRELRQTVIKQCHEQHHGGMTKTEARVRLDWYWPGISTDIRSVIHHCEVCQATKHSGQTKSANQQRLYAGRPWQVLSLDLVGPLPETPRGNTMILVLADHFTRWKDAIAIKDGTTQSIAEALERQVLCYFGLPERIHSDLGAQFESQLMRDLCRLWGVDKSHTTPYHPEGNGTVESGNRPLGDALRSLLLHRDDADWDLMLPQISRSLRATPHSFSGETPNFLMFGRELRLPDSLIADSPPEVLSKDAYAIKLKEVLEKAHKLLREKQLLIKGQDIKEPPLFTAGDKVWVRAKGTKKGTSSKLQPKFHGPFKIVQANDNHTYVVDMNGRMTTENEVRLKLFTEADYSWAQAPSLPVPTRQPTRAGMGNRRPQAKANDLQDTLAELLREARDRPGLRNRSESDRGNTRPTNGSRPTVGTSSSGECESLPTTSPIDEYELKLEPTEESLPLTYSHDIDGNHGNHTHEIISERNNGQNRKECGGQPADQGGSSISDNGFDFEQDFPPLERKSYFPNSSSGSSVKTEPIPSGNQATESRPQRNRRVPVSLRDYQLYSLQCNYIKSKDEMSHHTQPSYKKVCNDRMTQSCSGTHLVSIDSSLSSTTTTIQQQPTIMEQTTSEQQPTTSESTAILDLEDDYLDLVSDTEPEVPVTSTTTTTSQPIRINRLSVSEPTPISRSSKTYITVATHAEADKMLSKSQGACCVCSKSFKKMNKLQKRDHIYSHLTVYACKECGILATNSNRIRDHCHQVKHSQPNNGEPIDKASWKQAKENIMISHKHFPALPYKEKPITLPSPAVPDLRDKIRSYSPTCLQIRQVTMDRTPTVKFIDLPTNTQQKKNIQTKPQLKTPVTTATKLMEYKTSKNSQYTFKKPVLVTKPQYIAPQQNRQPTRAKQQLMEQLKAKQTQHRELCKIALAMGKEITDLITAIDNMD